MARRTKGTGSIWQRGDTWWYSYTQDGIKVQKSSKSTDSEEAKRQLTIALGEMAAGRDVTPGNATIDDLYQLVVADHKLRKLRDLRNVEWRYGAHVRPALGSLLASRFTPRQVRVYVEMRRREKASDASINRELAIVRHGFTLAVREDPPLVRRAPHILKLEEDNARQGFIEEAEYLDLRAALPDHLKCALVVGYHCGNRLGELRKLRIPQVDLAAGKIRIERRQAKGKEPRTLPIYGDMREWLEWQIARRVKGCDLLFHWKGRPLGSHLKGWSRACTAVGLEGLHFHDLRRSAVRNMERAGIPRHVAMRISGHRTESTYRRYDIVVEADIDAAAKKLAEYRKAQQSKGKAKLKRVK